MGRRTLRDKNSKLCKWSSCHRKIVIDDHCREHDKQNLKVWADAIRIMASHGYTGKQHRVPKSVKRRLKQNQTKG